jgi:hypothetical protein
MGKHAAPRTSPLRGRAAQRAVAVSAGTFVLCLGAAAPAVATSGLPTPPPLPQPIVDTVQKVSDIAGVTNPIAPAKTPKARHHHKRDAKQTAEQPLVQHATKPPAAKAKPATTAYQVPTYPIGGLRAAPATRTAQIADRAPAMASAPTTTHIIQTAGERMLGQIPGLPPTQDTSRILLVAMAMTIVGALSSGHIKAAQSRALA